MIRKQLFFACVILHLALQAGAQYAPQAGIAGSDAVPATSTTIVGWAKACNLVRGLQQIGDAAGGYAQAGDSLQGIGPADGSVVSLGDSGVATLAFAHPITNLPGPDFAVFENGFLNGNNAEEAFLELAFVEVSSDGVHFFRFPSVSLTPTTTQLSSLVGQNFMNARLLHNLAGKYITGYGTPFDLEELAGISGLNINRITHVRLIDVIGDITNHACLDSAGNKINDPFPTAFPTGGFDLDAVGVIHWLGPTVVHETSKMNVRLFPNPVSNNLLATVPIGSQLQLSDATGRVVVQQTASQPETILSLSALSAGIYYLTVQDEQGNRWAGKVFRQ